MICRDIVDDVSDADSSSSFDGDSIISCERYEAEALADPYDDNLDDEDAMSVDSDDEDEGEKKVEEKEAVVAAAVEKPKLRRPPAPTSDRMPDGKAGAVLVAAAGVEGERAGAPMDRIKLAKAYKKTADRWGRVAKHDGGMEQRILVASASFDFPESRLVAELYAAALESRGVPVTRTLGLGEWGSFWEVVVRGKLPDMLEVVRQNFAIIWTLITLVESLYQSEGGIGLLLYKQNRYLHLDGVLAIQLVILALGVAQDYAFEGVRRVFFPYAGLGDVARTL